MIFILIIIFVFSLPPIILSIIFINLWKQGNKIISIFILSLIFLYLSPIVCDIGCNMCGLDQKYAYKKVLNELKNKNLDPKNLKFVSKIGTCHYDFIYSDTNQTIDYAVFSTWLHGVKISFYPHTKMTNTQINIHKD